jgi:hypothetical protein
VKRKKPWELDIFEKKFKGQIVREGYQPSIGGQLLLTEPPIRHKDFDELVCNADWVSSFPSDHANQSASGELGSEYRTFKFGDLNSKI